MRLALAAMVMTGCLFGDDDGDPSNYVAVTDIAKAYQTAYCTYAARCGLFPDAASCQSTSLINNGSELLYLIGPSEVAAVRAGRVYYNGTHVKACLDAIAAQTCDRTDRDGRVLQIMPECVDVLRGTIDAGGACAIDAECVSGDCSTPISETTTCAMGTCNGDTPPSSAPAGLGQRCIPFCAVGLYCDDMTSVCAVLKSAGSSCEITAQCDYGLICASNGTDLRTCRVAPALGEPCPEFFCRDEGQYCDSATKTCKRYGLLAETCTSVGDCSPYYPCNFNMVPAQCKPGPKLGEGCVSQRCWELDTYCDPLTVTCLAQKAAGQVCTTANECANGGVCNIDLVPPVCEAPPVCF